MDENRRRLCAEVGAEEQDLTLGFQTHSTVVNRAEAGSRGAPGDGLWTDEPGIPMLALGADCALIAMARTNGSEPALAVLHAGWRGLLDGIVESAAADPRPRFRRSRRADDRPVLLRGGRRGREPLPGPIRRRHRQRPQARPLDRGRASRARSRSEHGRSTRPLHAMPRRSLLQRAPHRPAARNTGCPWPCPLNRSRRGSPASATRSAPTSRSSRPRSTSPSTTWPHWPRLESTSWARTARRTSRPSTQSTATRSAGTSSAICRAARRRS